VSAAARPASGGRALPLSPPGGPGREA
jgi:hypothetical protein